MLRVYSYPSLTGYCFSFSFSLSFSLSFFLSHEKMEKSPESENYPFLIFSSTCCSSCLSWPSSAKKSTFYLRCSSISFSCYFTSSLSISKKSNSFLVFLRLSFQSCPNLSNRKVTASLTHYSGLESLCFLNKSKFTL